MVDPDIVIVYGDQSSGAGASYSWVSEIAGNGKMRILETDPNRYARYELIFEGYEELPSYSTILIAPPPVDAEEPVHEVTWTFEGNVGDFFFARWMSVMVDKFVGASYEKGLAALKARCESMAEIEPAAASD